MVRFSRRLLCAVAVCGVLLTSCANPPAPPPKLTVAAAANLTEVFEEIASTFRKRTGIEVVLTFGSTAQLSQQIENGAPFDVFAAADTEHIDQLIAAERISKDSRAVYARGQLALWIPDGEKLGVQSPEDLQKPAIRFISIAQPELAPYGRAAVETLKSAGLWDKVLPKIVHTTNVNMARQYAATGNVNAAFTAYSLVLKDSGTIIKVDPKLHAQIDQALGVLRASKSPQARDFTSFVRGPEGRAILEKAGYLVP